MTNVSLCYSTYEFVHAFHEFCSLLFKCQRFLQLLCEGHNSKMQNYLRHQIDNTDSYVVVPGRKHVMYIQWEQFAELVDRVVVFC